MLSQIADFQAEADELHAVLARITETDFERVTAFKAWTVNDVLRHLHFGDLMAMASLRDPAEFKALRADVQAKKATGLTTRDEARQRFGHLAGHGLGRLWIDTARTLCTALAARNPDDRLTWAGPDMGVRMFATARQMETWSHGQEIHDVLGLDRPATDRLRNIAQIGVRTYGWTFANRGLPEPGPVPHVRLTGPKGDLWEWHPSSETNRVIGSALEFAQVVTQVRNIADTALVVTGEPARAWMAIAQCFAGPPETPPAPGTRRRSVARI